MWRLVPGKPRVITLIYFANLFRDFSRKLRENEYSVQLQALLAVMMAIPQNWNENTIGVDSACDLVPPLISLRSMEFPGCE